jgi:hypothetical protein
MADLADIGPFVETRPTRRKRPGDRAVRPDTTPPERPNDQLSCPRHPVGLRPHTGERTGPAWARWSTLRLTDLAPAGPVCSASPGRRLPGWRHPSQRSESPPEASSDRHIAYLRLPAISAAGALSCLAPSGGLEPSRRRRRRPNGRLWSGGASGPSGAALKDVEKVLTGMMLMTMMLMATPAAGSDPSSHGLRACNLIVGLLVGVAADFGGCGGVT